MNAYLERLDKEIAGLLDAAEKSAQNDTSDVEHKLIYTPELYGNEWTEIDTDQYKEITK
jgi:hypothetical protein